MANNINYRFGARPDYTVGNIVLTAGSKDFTVTNGADLQAVNILPGFTIHHSNGLVLPIAEVTSATSGKLFFDCPDSAAGTIETFIRYQPDGSSLSAAVRDLLSKINSGLLSSISSLSMTKGMGIIGDDLDGTVTLFDFTNLQKIADLTLAENQIIVGDADNKVKAVDLSSDNIKQGSTNLFLTSSERKAIQDLRNSDNITEGTTHLFLTATERSQIAASLKSQNNNIGMIVPFALATAPEGWLEADGQRINRADAPLLWAVVQKYGGAVNETNWTANSGAYSTGDGATNFRLPDLRGEFIRGLDSGRGLDNGRTLGSVQSDAIRNITGNFYIHGSENGTSIYTVAGAFGGTQIGQFSNTNPRGNGATSIVNPNFDASRVVPTANENRPRNVALIMCIRYQ